MVRSTSGKTARSRGRSLLRTDRKDIHWLGHLRRRWCKPVDREAMRSHLFHQALGARPYFNQARIITHVKPVTPSGTMPTSRFSPNHGRARVSCLATRLNVPLAKIQPTCRPIGSDNERVNTRAWARIQPIRNNVANAETNIVALLNWPNEWAMEFKPEAHVTIVDVRSGAFRKWITEKMADVAKIDMYCRPVFNRTPRTIPRKKASSISGTAIAAPSILLNRTQAKLCRNAYTSNAISKAPQQSRGIAERRIPAKTSRLQRGFGARPKSTMLRTLLTRRNGQSSTAAAIRIAR